MTAVIDSDGPSISATPARRAAAVMVYGAFSGPWAKLTGDATGATSTTVTVGKSASNTLTLTGIVVVPLSVDSVMTKFWLDNCPG